MSFKDDLEAAKTAPKRSLVVVVTVNDKRYRFRVTKMDGREYAAETLKHPPRFDVKLDMEYGYDLNALTEAVMPRCAVLLDGDTETVLEPEEWADLFAIADGGALQAMANTVFELNEFSSAKAVAALKKALSGSAPN